MIEKKDTDRNRWYSRLRHLDNVLSGFGQRCKRHKTHKRHVCIGLTVH